MVCSILSGKDLASSKQLNTLIISRMMTHLLYLNSIFHVLYVCLFILNSLFRKYHWTKWYLDRDKGNLRQEPIKLCLSLPYSLYSIVHNQQLKISRPLPPIQLFRPPPPPPPKKNARSQHLFLRCRGNLKEVYGVCVYWDLYTRHHKSDEHDKHKFLHWKFDLRPAGHEV